MNKLKLIQQLIDQINSLPHRDTIALDALKKRSEMYIRNIFGEASKYLGDLKKIHFSPMVYPADESYYNRSWSSGVSELKNLYETMREEISIFASDIDNSNVKEKRRTHKKKSSGKIFIVHGHNDGIKNAIARFIEKLGLETIILHEKPNNGKTIIEKFEQESSDVDFAIVLLTVDDQGGKMGDTEGLRARARQNVIFEFGYFIGIMGRSKVVALVEDDVEIPSDYSGVIYLPFDNAGAWKLNLAKELKNTGINVDLNLAI